MKRTSLVRNPMKPAVLIAALVGLTALAGCLGSIGDANPPQNLAPNGVLEVDRPERWSGEKFTFNANASEDPDGEITRYRFDFGDGTEVEVEDAANATSVEHRYEAGGVYAVTLTVTDDGANNTGKSTGTTSILVVVHERQDVPRQIDHAAPNGDENASKSSHAFTVGEQATAYEADLDVQGMLPLGTSELTLRVLDSEGNVLEEQNVTVQATENTTVHLQGALQASGEHLIEMIVRSGGVSIGGELRIYYDNTTVAA